MPSLRPPRLFVLRGLGHRIRLSCPACACKLLRFCCTDFHSRTSSGVDAVRQRCGRQLDPFGALCGPKPAFVTFEIFVQGGADVITTFAPADVRFWKVKRLHRQLPQQAAVFDAWFPAEPAQEAFYARQGKRILAYMLLACWCCDARRPGRLSLSFTD